MEVEVRSYSLGVLTNGLYVVEADHTIFHRLVNLRGGTIELQLNLQLLEPIYLRDQSRPYFFNGTVESAQFGGLLLKIVCGLANLRVRMHLRADRKVANGDLLFAQCDPGFRIGANRPAAARSTTRHSLMSLPVASTSWFFLRSSCNLRSSASSCNLCAHPVASSFNRVVSWTIALEIVLGLWSLTFGAAAAADGACVTVVIGLPDCASTLACKMRGDASEPVAWAI